MEPPSSKEDEKQMLDGAKNEDECVFQLSKDTTCGIGCFKGPFLQKFANDKAFVFIYGTVGCFLSAAFAYFSGTISTIEKRFKIPSKNTGIITVGSDISTMVLSIFLSYFFGQSHRPRWVALGTFAAMCYCLLNAIPHFIYGPGDDALALTTSTEGNTTSAHEFAESYNRKTLCQANETECEVMDGSFTPQIILFVAQAFGGMANAIYFTLGVAYLDDNIKKTKTPALISFSYFIRTLGPAVGYSLASYCLSHYIAPHLKPVIKSKDPRWLGAWWIGWLFLGCSLAILGSLIGLFPKVMPKTAVRKLKLHGKEYDQKLPTSLAGLWKTSKRLLMNPILMFNHFSAVFYMFGFLPYWMFMPKYIEAVYKQSASFSNLVTGTFGLVFAALGILASGLVLTKFKPRARSLVVWNVIVGASSSIGAMSYSLLGCPTTNQAIVSNSGELNFTMGCNQDCHCNYVKYSPICANGKTFISPCHAGCTGITDFENGTKIYTDCACMPPELPQIALPGACPVDCNQQFYVFLAIVCLLKFIGSTGRATNFLIGVRCVDEKDKPISMGIGIVLFCLLAFIPSPIFYGYIFDSTCLIWGKTCTRKGNCWLYNADLLLFRLNITSGVFIGIGAFWDFLIWFYCEDLKIFDEEEVEMKPKENNEIIS